MFPPLTVSWPAHAQSLALPVWSKFLRNPPSPERALNHRAQQLARTVGGASHSRSDLAGASSGKVVLQRVHGAPLPTPEQDEISKMAKEEVHQATRCSMCWTFLLV